MNVKTRTKLYETLRTVLKERSDHDIAPIMTSLRRTNGRS
jgi:hypothetical protein